MPLVTLKVTGKAGGGGRARRPAGCSRTVFGRKTLCGL